MPRIVFISDTHLRHKFNIPEGDILVHAGDMTSRGDIYNNEVDRAMKWFGGLHHPVKIFCAGNHDFMFENSPDEARALVPPCVDYLEDTEVTHLGLRFYGSPYSPRFFDWAFNQDRGPVSRARWNKIPEGIDVLITHGPPYGIMDRTPDCKLVGCQDLLGRVQALKPKVHVFGHIHQDEGATRILKIGDTTYINASICNESYKAVHPPIVLDI